MFAQLPSSTPAVSSLLPKTPAGASAGAELVTSDGRSLALVSARLIGEAQGGLARLVLEQTFENTYDENLRVTYRMPLPADGAVSGYEFAIGDRVIRGTIDKKAQARERFERAIALGKTAALLEQERADIFTQQIGNIPARETLVARIIIDQRLVWLPEGEWELRFPTVIGPRYIGKADTAADVRATHIKVTDQPLRSTIQIAVAIKDAIAGGGKPSSPSHGIVPGGNGVTELKNDARLDRDIVLRWRVATPTVGLSLAAARPAAGGKLTDSFALLTIVPPARDAKPVAVPRDLVVLLDTSGSMGGFPLDKAKQVISMLIDSLDEQDRFELIEFNYQPTRYLAEPTVATAKAKQAAIQWIRSRVADGGTEIRAAVIDAMDTLRVGAQRQVIVVTDGYVGGEQQIIEAMNRRLPKSCRVHVLGVGSAVNRSLATSIARAGRGVEVIIGVDEDAERGAKRLLDRTRMPVLTNVEVSGSALLRQAPELMSDCFEGSPLVAALALRPEGGELIVKGQLARDTWEQTIRVGALQPGEGNQAIVALYGRERVADVEAHALFTSVNGEVEELGLTFQIATRMTSWIAIDETRLVTGPSRDQLIPQELPYGTSASAFGLRAPQQSGATRAGSLRSLVARDGFGSVARSISLEDASEPFDVVDRSRAYDDDSASPAGSYDAEELSIGEYDFGEEAPRETFGDAPSAPAQSPARPLSGPPAPAARRSVASSTPMKSRSLLSGGYGNDKSDDPFATEEPTGKVASAPTFEEKKEMAPEPVLAARQPAMTASAPGMPARQPETLGKVVSSVQSAAAPPAAYQQRKPSFDEMNALGLTQQQPLPQRRRWPVALAVVLVLLALLAWWLLG